jgi:pyruvate/2-oxoglutarate dehydrogenase complex dihydrolipoamide dehydrogenase (E3) component
MYQARIATSDILGQAPEPASYRALPRVTFTDPEVGAVGLTEAQARGRVHAQVPVAVLSQMIYAYPTFTAPSKTPSPGFPYVGRIESRMGEG